MEPITIIKRGGGGGGGDGDGDGGGGGGGGGDGGAISNFPAPYSHLTSRPWPPSPPAKDLKVLTYNLAGLPPHLNINPPRRRCSLLASKILRCDLDVDVLCFQEAFDDVVKDDIIERLKDHYPHVIRKPISHLGIHWSLGGNYLAQDSGLFLLSKRPFLWAEAREFGSEALGADYCSQKGVLGVGIDLGNGNSALVFTTHLQANPGMDPFWWPVINGFEKSKRARRMQVRKCLH